MTRVLTLILAAMTSGILAGLVGSMTLNAVLRTQGVEGDATSGFLVFGTLLSLYGLAAALVLGLPAHAVLSRMGRTRRGAYVLVGLVAGLLVGLLFSGLRPDGWMVLLTGLCAGAAGGFGFWMVARPDRRPRA